MKRETTYQLLWLAAEKAARSVQSKVHLMDWKGELTLPTVFWSGIDSPGDYCPSIKEWATEVAKRHFRKVCVKRFGMSSAEATFRFYNPTLIERIGK